MHHGGKMTPPPPKPQCGGGELPRDIAIYKYNIRPVNRRCSGQKMLEMLI